MTLNDSIQKAVVDIMELEARLDVIVHNVGYMVFDPGEAFTPK